MANFKKLKRALKRKRAERRLERAGLEVVELRAPAIRRKRKLPRIKISLETKEELRRRMKLGFGLTKKTAGRVGRTLFEATREAYKEAKPIVKRGVKETLAYQRRLAEKERGVRRKVKRKKRKPKRKKKRGRTITIRV